MSSSIYTDAGAPIVRIRSFPHLKEIRGERGTINLEGKRIKFDKFIADIEVAMEPETVDEAQVGDSLLEYGETLASPLLTQTDEEIETTDPLVIYTTSDVLGPGGLLLAQEDAENYGILLTGGDDYPPGPKIRLRWSNSRGASWAGSLTNTLGATGQYLTQPMWRRLGFARDRVWELSWTAPCKTALNGAWVEMRVMKT